MSFVACVRSLGIPDGLVRFLHCVTALYDWRRQSSEKRGPPGRHRSTTSGIFLYLGFSVRELDCASGKPTCRNRRGIQETFARIRECAAVISVHQPFDETDNEPRGTKEELERTRSSFIFLSLSVAANRINYLSSRWLLCEMKNVRSFAPRGKKMWINDEMKITLPSTITLPPPIMFLSAKDRWNWTIRIVTLIEKVKRDLVKN